MSKHILAFYDRSPSLDQTIKQAMQTARAEHASLYVLAIPPDSHDASGPDGASTGARLMHELGAIARRGLHMGIDIDGKYLDTPTLPDIKAVLEAQKIDEVVLAPADDADGASPNAKLLHELSTHCPVPVITVH